MSEPVLCFDPEFAGCHQLRWTQGAQVSHFASSGGAINHLLLLVVSHHQILFHAAKFYMYIFFLEYFFMSIVCKRGKDCAKLSLFFAPASKIFPSRKFCERGVQIVIQGCVTRSRGQRLISLPLVCDWFLAANLLSWAGSQKLPTPYGDGVYFLPSIKMAAGIFPLRRFCNVLATSHQFSWLITLCNLPGVVGAGFAQQQIRCLEFGINPLRPWRSRVTSDNHPCFRVWGKQVSV